MAVTLLPLAGGHLSLELAGSDLLRVAALIRERYGVPESDVYPLATGYRFAGCAFTFQNEWDDPCLISDSDEGDRVLRALHAALATSGGEAGG